MTASALLAAVPPMPSSAADLERWEHTRLRRRLLYGKWEDDLRALMHRALGEVRAERWKIADTSANVFRSGLSQVAVAYDRPPDIAHADAASAEVLGTALHRAGLWSLKQRYLRDLLGMRQMLMAVDVVDGRLLFYPVFPDLVVAEAPPEHPDRPHIIRESVVRTVAERTEWTTTVWDISDPSAPRVSVLDGAKRDISAAVLRDGDGSAAPDGGLAGERYRWRYSDGTPFIPRVLDHASKTGCLWDAFEAREAVDGTLMVALLWSFFGHAMRSASWGQRYGIDLDTGADVVGTGDAQRRQVVTDPSAVALFYSSEDAAGQPQLGQWGSPTNPMSIAEATALYERRLAAFMGISPSDIQRVAGDPRSGYALSVSREAARENQARIEPQLHAGDEELMGKAAALLNRDQGLGLPEEGWRIRYQAVPQSAAEREAERTHLLELMDRGLVSRVEVYRRLNPGTTELEAVQALDDIASVNGGAGDGMEEGAEGASPDRPGEGRAIDGPVVAEKVQDLALNGAQVSALVDIVAKVAAQELPRQAGVQIIATAFQLSNETAERLMGDSGTGFVLEQPDETREG